MARKDVLLRASVDQAAAEILDAMAEQEADGNRSLMVRRVIREAGERRGLADASVRQAENGDDRPHRAAIKA